ncbi:MAG TPA: response regulator transcription factor [Candidatus Corynebacterium avicola]|uniref:Response regulator transcription factor n=1 Tax=Candidatus Corynebacterium avicola TaxID=2838527 RepID=A0A9D1RQS3_9CORY|nr:response regulator transcription factor [Candidatus Corynebacterium avicola]
MTDEASHPVPVFLVDDHSMFRTGVRAELDSHPQVEVVGEAGSVAEAVGGIADAAPRVVLLDVHMPDGGGLAVLRKVLGSSATGAPQFLGLSVSDDPTDVISLIRGGARGYVTKSIDGKELVDSILRVDSGDAVFSPRLAGYVLDAFASGGDAPEAPEDPDEPTPLPDDADESMLSSLTPREKEVLRLLARGYTYREMAQRLFISVKTVETHVSNVLRKTQQTNRHSLSRWVSDNHLG